MNTPADPVPAAAHEAPAPPTWLDILGAAAVAAGFAVWAYRINAEQGFQPSLGAAAVAVWAAGFAAIRLFSRRRILAGREVTAHQAGLERAHLFVGAMLFTFLGVMSARQGQWLTAAGLIVAAIVFGLGTRTRPAA